LSPSLGFQRRSVRGTLNTITSNQGIFIKGLKSANPLDAAVEKIAKMCSDTNPWDSIHKRQRSSTCGSGTSDASASSWASLDAAIKPGRQGSKVKTRYSRGSSRSVTEIEEEEVEVEEEEEEEEEQGEEQ
jgi:hypothetical protein